MHFAIAGNIGAGKTTLTALLAKHYKWEAHYEDVSDNPYLDDFYANMERWSFNLQVFSSIVASAKSLIFARVRRILSKIEPSTRTLTSLPPTYMLWD